jgi:hypothetical protein
MLAVPLGACLSVVAATNSFAQGLQPRRKFPGSSAPFPLRSGLHLGSPVSGSLSQRRSARHARRNGGVLSLQANCLPGWRGAEGLCLAQPMAACLRSCGDRGCVQIYRRVSSGISNPFSFGARRSYDSSCRPCSSCVASRVVRLVSGPLHPRMKSTDSHNYIYEISCDGTTHWMLHTACLHTDTDGAAMHSIASAPRV